MQANWELVILAVGVGLLAQLVERCTGIAEAMGSNPHRPEFFFRPYFHYCLGSAHHCEDHFHSREILSWSLMGVKGLKSVLREIFEPGSKFAIQEF